MWVIGIFKNFNSHLYKVPNHDYNETIIKLNYVTQNKTAYYTHIGLTLFQHKLVKNVTTKDIDIEQKNENLSTYGLQGFISEWVKYIWIFLAHKSL